MVFGILILIGAAVWFGYAVYKGYRGHGKKPETDATATRQGAAVPADDWLKWSGDESATMPIKILTRAQWDCLSYASRGKDVIAVPPNEMYVKRADGFVGQPAKTIQSLVKHGFLQGTDSIYSITDLGLRALATLPTRY